MKNETKIFSSNIVELTNEIANTPIEILLQRGVPEQYVFLSSRKVLRKLENKNILK